MELGECLPVRHLPHRARDGLAVHASERNQALPERHRTNQQARQTQEGIWDEPSQVGLLMAGSIKAGAASAYSDRHRYFRRPAQGRMLHTDIPHDSLPPGVHLGIAGWAIRREHSHRFADVGSHLQRYATLFNAVEINSCFYRPHRRSTYERWAASVPDTFRFTVKLPKVVTHEQRLVDAEERLEQFLDETAGLGEKRGPILIQLPPSFAFDAVVIPKFLTQLRQRFDGDAVLEPRHETWFTDDVDSLLREHRIARVAADPARVPAARIPGGYQGIVYIRLHGSPRIYYSAYTPEVLDSVGNEIQSWADRKVQTWCIFDNTALGFATSDAVTVQAMLARKESAL
jgi:uncharacterized protein YecE (DUF72 family)